MNARECFIGIDFGKTNVRFAVAEDKPELKFFTKRPYERGTPGEMHRQIFDGMDAALEEAGCDPGGLMGVGIDVPAVVILVAAAGVMAYASTLA